MDLKDFIKNNRQEIDIYELPNGHEKRFLQKLNRKTAKQPPLIKKHLIKLFVAASLLLVIGTGWQYFNQNKQIKDTEILVNERYFSQIIQDEIAKVKTYETPETKKVFDDAMKQIELLEADYQKLVKDYQINRDRFILNAMIENFQQRIGVLQFVKKEIQQVKQNKTYQNEKNRA